MADDLTIDNGEGTDYDVATDDDGSGNHVQIVKLAMAADGSRTAIPADSDGMLVNLGTNNDVTVSGVSTSAKQDTIIGHVDGIEGLLTTIDGDTGTVAGAVSGTEMQVDVVAALPAGTNNIGDVDVASIAAGDNNIGNVDIVTVPAPLSSTGGGTEAAALRVTIANNSTGVLSVDDNGAALTVDNGGTFATQVDGAALTALQLIDNPILVDDAAFTPGTSSVNMAGFQADEASTDSVNEGDAGAARMTLDRKLITAPQAHGAGGLSIFRSLDLDETEEEVSSAACCLYGWFITNRRTSAIYVKFYNATAANTTVGSTTPVMTLAIPGNSTDHIAANALGGIGIGFGTALSVAATTGVADADTGAPGANECVINLFYKA